MIWYFSLQNVQSTFWFSGWCIHRWVRSIIFFRACQSVRVSAHSWESWGIIWAEHGAKFNVQCMYAVMRSATCDFTTIASGRMILSIKSIIRKTWGSECPFRQRHENTGRSDACRYCIFWSILPLLFHAILCFPGLSATWHHGSRAKWLTVAKSRLPLMSMKTLAGCANANSKQEPTVQILSLQKVPECSGMGRAWPCNAGTNKSGSSLLCSVFTCLVEWPEVTPEVKMEPWGILKPSVLPNPSKSCHIQAFVNRTGSSDRVKASRLETCRRDTVMITFAPDHRDLDKAWGQGHQFVRVEGIKVLPETRDSDTDNIWYPVVAVLYSLLTLHVLV